MLAREGCAVDAVSDNEPLSPIHSQESRVDSYQAGNHTKRTMMWGKRGGVNRSQMSGNGAGDWGQGSRKGRSYNLIFRGDPADPKPLSRA